jgi:hypothetical protein
VKSKILLIGTLCNTVSVDEACCRDESSIVAVGEMQSVDFAICSLVVFDYLSKKQTERVSTIFTHCVQLK